MARFSKVGCIKNISLVILNVSSLLILYFARCIEAPLQSTIAIRDLMPAQAKRSLARCMYGEASMECE